MTTVSWKSLKQSADDASRPLPKDWYLLEVVKTEATTASTGSPMIKAQLRVIDGPANGRVLFTNFVLSLDNPNALIIFFRHMASFGFDDTFFDTLPEDAAIGLQVVADNLIGRTVMAEVGTRIFQGSERNEIQQYKPASNAPGGQGVATPAGTSGSVGRPPTGGSGAANGTPPVPSVPSTPPTPVVPTKNSTGPTDGDRSAPPSVPPF